MPSEAIATDKHALSMLRPVKFWWSQKPTKVTFLTSPMCLFQTTACARAPGLQALFAPSVPGRSQQGRKGSVDAKTRMAPKGTNVQGWGGPHAGMRASAPGMGTTHRYDEVEWHDRPRKGLA